MPDFNLVEAVRLALTRAMEDDANVIILGEDVGVDGGVFRATDGLVQLFGESRVLDTPIAELGISGVAIGLAAQGLKPVVEIQFMGFIYPTIDQLANHASRMRNRTRGRLTCPMVLRAPFGGGVHAPEHHSESMEAMLAHIPGLRVVVPSSPSKAYGLLLSAIRSRDRVLFPHPTRLYRSVREQVIDDGAALPLDTAFVLRSGKDLTVVTWGAMVQDTMSAADRLAASGIDAEVVDLATLKPIDTATVLASVQRTGRCVVVHEAPISGGLGGEIAARIADQALTALLAPIKRVAGYDTIMPLPRLEAHYLPSVDRIMEAARGVMEYG
jgi:2-oxoisovalerate dehydrogenase E1 component beta subunit